MYCSVQMPVNKPLCHWYSMQWKSSFEDVTACMEKKHSHPNFHCSQLKNADRAASVIQLEITSGTDPVGIRRYKASAKVLVLGYNWFLICIYKFHAYRLLLCHCRECSSPQHCTAHLVLLSCFMQSLIRGRGILLPLSSYTPPALLQ